MTVLLIAGLKAREPQFPRAFERDVEIHFSRMVRREFQRRDLERSLDRAEIRQDQLPGPDRPREEQLADLGVRRLVLEYPAAGDRGALDAAAAQQFAPPSRALGVGG